MNGKIREALRMMGHLLETNGTVGAKARFTNGKGTMNYADPRVRKWCLVGAVDIVFDSLYGKTIYHDSRYESVRDYLELSLHIDLLDAWEPREHGAAARKAIVEKLKNA